MEISRLIEISQDLGLVNEAAQLQLIKDKSVNNDCELILPLVGEFSAGKTSLINALLDSPRKLETDTEPTTATLFEIHFGCENCYADYTDNYGNLHKINDFSSLKNKELKDTLVVNIFDTSNKMPSSIVLVDTPGLSSPIAQHRQVLIDFLPEADAVLLVIDINAQLTRSLTDFVAEMELAKRPVFLVVTKCDTKAKEDVKATVEYLSRECKLPLRQIACVSAQTGDLTPLFDLLSSVQKEKQSILNQVNSQRIKKIIDLIISHIDEMLSVSNTDADIKQAIQEKELELRTINNKINQLVNNSQSNLEDEKIRINRQFEDAVFTRLDYIVKSSGSNYDAEAVSAINNIASINLSEFKTNAHRIIMDQCLRDNNTGIDLDGVQGVDLSQLNVEGLSYNLDLNTIGHKYDKQIATGVKVAAVAAAVVAVVATAGAAAPAAAGAAEVGTATAAGAEAATAAVSAGEIAGAASAIDTVTDIGSMISNAKTAKRIEQAIQVANTGKDLFIEGYDTVNEINTQVGQKVGQDKGFVEGIVGLVTDSTMGKPQRRRAISIYLNETLMPQFRKAMENNCFKVTQILHDYLVNAAQVTIAEKKLALEALEKHYIEQKDSYTQQLNKLRDYKSELLTQ